MNRIAEHIIAATGEDQLEEPRGTHGDYSVGFFIAGMVLGWVVGVVGLIG